MIRIIAAIVMLAPTLQAETRRLGIIDFHGYSGLDLDHLRAALPFHEGDALPSSEQLAASRESFAKAIGRRQVDFHLSCCLDDGRAILNVGIEEPGAPSLTFNSRPNGDSRLPAAIVKLCEDHGRELRKGARQGVNGEDESRGYQLSDYAPARDLELRMRDYALDNVDLLITVLNSSAEDAHRAMAAELLGYAGESQRQIGALAHASFDPHREVRDNAIRALSILIDFDPKFLAQIPLDGYVALLHSVNFSDRNQACALIDSFTKSRDPKVLGVLRSRALGPLLEMAQWKTAGHALCAFASLGRIAGLEEPRIDELSVTQNIKPILQALQ